MKNFKYNRFMKKDYILVFHIALVFAVLTSCEPTKKADLIIYNATVYTVDEDFNKATAIAIRGDRFIAVGSDDEVLGHYNSDIVYDAGGQFIYPGFNDGHSHFLGYGLAVTSWADLVGTRSFEEVIQKVKQHYKAFPSSWVLGRGWDQNDWEEKSFPTKTLLDKSFPNIPVVLRRIDGHALIANSEAMKRAGITKDSEVDGGEVIKKNGEPTGVFVDNAMGLITQAIPEPAIEERITALKVAEKNCFAAGLTTVTDAGMGKADILLIDSLHNAGVLNMRVYAMISPTEENFDHFFSSGPLFTGKLTVSAVKLYIDGALGSRGALLLEPYSDDPGNLGLQLNKEEYYQEICKDAYNAGFQVNTHAIGDSGNRIMLNTYGLYLKGENDRRWRVEHAQVVNPEDLKYFDQYDIIPSVQSTHCTSDMYWADERLGEERVKHAYAYKDLLEQNGWLINGTDFPVEEIYPLKTFYAAVARKDLEGWPEKGFQPENAISREEALRSVTIWPAMGSFEESFKGTIEKGKVADFIILEKDLMAVPEEEIPFVKIIATYLGGEMVFSMN
jgi:predicted amidohydrolase YtcJ